MKDKVKKTCSIFECVEIFDFECVKNRSVF